MLEILFALSSGILGVFAGAQIAEGTLLVPYWKTLEPQQFFDLHKTYGKVIYRFFAPLTILATLIPLFTVGYSWYEGTPAKLYVTLMGVFVLLFFSTYFIFFKKANQQFVNASLSHDELPQALNRWAKWHWGRIYLEVLALICALLVLMQI